MTSTPPEKPDAPLPDEASTSLPVIGWREHVALPDLGISLFDARIDTGAKTSSLHAVAIEEFDQADARFVRFSVPGVDSSPLVCEAPLIEFRRIRSSNGEASVRPVIQSTIRLAGYEFSVELTLADRSRMKYPMLIGRSALRGRFLVDVSQSCAGD